MMFGRRRPQREQPVVVVVEQRSREPRRTSANLERSRKRREQDRPYRYIPVEDFVEGVNGCGDY